MKKEAVLTIGIIQGEKQKEINILLKNIFISLGYSLNYEDSRKNIHILNKENAHIMIIDLNSEMLLFSKKMQVEFHIIIHKYMNFNKSQENTLREIVSKSKYILINSDDESWKDLLIDNISTMVVSYGFNNKASINLSSHNVSDVIEVNICMQRKMVSLDNKTIEPFDLPIKIRKDKASDIYSIMSLIGCLLVLGMDIPSINRRIFSKGIDI